MVMNNQRAWLAVKGSRMRFVVINRAWIGANSLRFEQDLNKVMAQFDPRVVWLKTSFLVVFCVEDKLERRAGMATAILAFLAVASLQISFCSICKFIDNISFFFFFLMLL